eukprot:m.7611 g.7611  ORF g.7611 m.7611 type:complete len:694 (+) comp2775_c0_seq1:106-2187(+)
MEELRERLGSIRIRLCHTEDESATEAANELARLLRSDSYDEVCSRAQLVFEATYLQLLALLDRAAEKPRIAATRALLFLSMFPLYKAALVNCGILPHLKRLFTGSEEARTWATCCAESLAFAPETGLLLFQAGFGSSAFSILANGPEQAAPAALGLISNLADLPPVKTALFSPSAVHEILAVLERGHTETCSKGTGVLFTFALRSEFRQPLIDCGAIPVLRRMMRSGSDTSRANACATIFLLCHADRLSAEGVPIPPATCKDEQVPSVAELVAFNLNLLSSGGDRLQAGRAVNQMVLHPPTARVVAEHTGSLLKMVEAFNNPTSSYEWDIRGALFSLIFNMSATLDQPGLAKLRDAGVVEQLLPLASKPKAPEFLHVVLSLANVLQNDDSALGQQIVESADSILTELSNVLEAAVKEMFYKNFLWQAWAPLQGLANLSVNADCRRRMVESGILAQVVRLFLTTQDERSLTFICRLFRNLAQELNLKSVKPSPWSRIKRLEADMSMARNIRHAAAAVLYAQAVAHPARDADVESPPLMALFAPSRLAAFRDRLCREFAQTHAQSIALVGEDEAMPQLEDQTLILILVDSATRQHEPSRIFVEYALALDCPKIVVSCGTDADSAPSSLLQCKCPSYAARIVSQACGAAGWLGMLAENAAAKLELPSPTSSSAAEVIKDPVFERVRERAAAPNTPK